MLTQIAQITNPSIGAYLSGRIGEGGSGFLGDLLSIVITIILIAGSLFFFFQLLTGAVAWIGSGGDKTALEGARGKILNAGLGLVLLFAAFAIITLVENIFGVGILRFTLPTFSSVGSPAPDPVWCPAIMDWCVGRCTAAGCMTF
jgi:hypothetical protein